MFKNTQGKDEGEENGVQIGSLRLVYFQVEDLNGIDSGLVVLLARGS